MNGSGDIFVAFSTANEEAAANESGEARLRILANSDLNPLFEGVVQATEEAIVNSMVAARDMTRRERPPDLRDPARTSPGNPPPP